MSTKKPKINDRVDSLETDTDEFDPIPEDLISLFQLDNSKIQSLIDGFNRYGANLSLKKFAELTGIEPSTRGRSMMQTLAYLTHQYLRHNELFLSEMSRYELDEAILNKTKHFLEGLNSKGKEGLNMMYEALLTMTDWPHIESISDGGIQLKEIVDEKNTVLGYLPFLRFRIGLTDEQDELIHYTLFANFDQLYSMINGLNNMYLKFKESTRMYKKTLGDVVLLQEDE